MGLNRKSTLSEPWRVSRLLEADPATPTRHRFEVILVTEGKGNKKDRYAYTQAAIDDPQTAKAFEGKPCYLNHQDRIEQQTRPENDVKNICGYFSNVHPEGNALKGILTTTSNQAGQEASALLMDELQFESEHPGQTMCGFSINADGDISGETQEEDGPWKNVVRIPAAVSCDLVTLPARGGKVVSLVESEAGPAGLADILQKMREFAEASGEVPQMKQIERMVNQAITAHEGEKQMFPPTAPAGAPAPAIHPPVPAPAAPQAEDEGKALRCAAYKHMSEKHMAEGNAEMAEKYKKMAEAEGALTIYHDPAAPPTAPAAPAAHQSEEEVKKQEEAEKAKAAESDGYRMQVIGYRLKESGLPEVFHKSILREAKSLGDKEVDEMISDRMKEYDHTLREASAGMPHRVGAGSTSPQNQVQAALKSAGLI